MTKCNYYTDPITYFSYYGGTLYTQHETSEAINESVDGDNEVAPGVTLGQLLATAPQLLDACEDTVALLKQEIKPRRLTLKSIDLLNEAIKEARL